MNIFVTSSNPVHCAVALDDRRLVKMVLETAQLICTALAHEGYSVPYRPTHTNHPCSVWARSSRNNLLWLWKHGRELGIEYDRRYSRLHASSEVILGCEKLVRELCRDAQAPVRFVNCARNERLGLDFTAEPVFTAYKKYLCAKWDEDGKLARWTNRTPPTWYLYRRS